MEGGYLPWKTQKIDNNCPPMEYFTKSLPPPPHGSFWERDLEGNWNLMKLSDNTNEDGSVIFTKPSIVEHTIMPNDTLPGICLQYRVSAIDIRRMNMFSGNNIHIKSKLLIPINAGVTFRPQVETEDVILQKFKYMTNESPQEARLYLEENNWKIDLAYEAWKSDNQWEKEEQSHPEIKAGKFSSEIPVEIVAPLAIEEIETVNPVEVTYSPPTADLMARTEAERPQSKKFHLGIFRPIFRPLLGR